MTVSKRKGSKNYWSRFSFNSISVNRSTGTSNREAALKIEAKWHTDMVLEKHGVKKSLKDGAKEMSFTDAVEEYLKKQKTKRSRKPGTFCSKKTSCAAMSAYFGEKPVSRIEFDDIEDFIAWRCDLVSRKTGNVLSNNSINHEISVLKAIFKRLLTRRLILEDPSEEIELLPSGEQKYHVITEDEEKLYLLACPQPLQDVATLIVETGMRPCEVYSLERRHVAIFEGWEARGIDENGLTGNTVHVEDGKTKSATRTLLLSPAASAILQTRMKRLQGDNLFPHLENDHLPPVSLLEDEQLKAYRNLYAQKLSIQHRRVKKRLGIDFRLYDCRHTYATRCYASGFDLRTIAALLGHKKLDQLIRYTHVSAVQIQNVQKALHQRKQNLKTGPKRLA